MRYRTRAVAGLIATLLIVGGSAGVGSASPLSDRSPEPPAFPALAAHWWQWVLETPKPVNPLLDQTGANCRKRQPSSGPFFLAGVMAGTVTRSCAVPDDRALFFPVINLVYGAFLNDPVDQRTVEFARTQVACERGATSLTVVVDGQSLPVGSVVHEQSNPFFVQLPRNNIFDLTPQMAKRLILSPTVDEGDYVLLPPLRRGTHTIRFGATYPTVAGTACTGGTVDTTYRLTVD